MTARTKATLAISQKNKLTNNVQVLKQKGWSQNHLGVLCYSAQLAWSGNLPKLSLNGILIEHPRFSISDCLKILCGGLVWSSHTEGSHFWGMKNKHKINSLQVSKCGFGIRENWSDLQMKSKYF